MAGSSITFLLLLGVIQPSLTQFVLEFNVHAVTTNGDCSEFDQFDFECETYLNRFCLRPFGHPRSTDDNDCPLGADGERLGPGFDDLPVSRQILSNQSWPGGFQMYIRAYDEDPVTDDLLDNIFIGMELPESRNFTAIQEFTGEMNRIIVNMTFRVMMCPENFYGTNCDTFCVAQDDDQNGHYTCNGDGSIQCLPGFENTANNCRDEINPCASTPCANNGNCTAMGPFTFTCQCAPGYTGATCEDVIDPCEEVTCPDNSVCVNGSICVCMPGFEIIGELCAHPTTTGTPGSQVGTPVIVGSSIGGVLALAFILLLLIVVIVLFIVKSRRSKSHHELLAENGSLSNMTESKDTLRLEMTKESSAVMKKDSMMDNPVYDQVSPHNSPSPEQQESSTSFSNAVTENNASTGMTTHVANNPVYGVETAHPKPHRSTIREVLNPVYGDPSVKQTESEGNVYSSVDQPSPQPSASETGEQEYSYAMVEAKVALSQLGKEDKGKDTVNSSATQEHSGEDVDIMEHEYAVVDKSAKAKDNAAAMHDQTVLPYDQLKHKQKEQVQTRLAENEELGYSAFT